MTDSIKNTHKPCRADFKCRYKVGDTCVFGDVNPVKLDQTRPPIVYCYLLL